MAELQDCVKLHYLDLGNNLFREDFQFPNDVLQLTNLKCLYLSYCNIQGAIPAGIGNLKQLTILQLSDNNMTGEIPTEIGKLANLRNLESDVNGELIWELIWSWQQQQFVKVL